MQGSPGTFASAPKTTRQRHGGTPRHRRGRIFVSSKNSTEAGEAGKMQVTFPDATSFSFLNVAGHVRVSLIPAYVPQSGCLKVLLSPLTGCHADEDLVFLQQISHIFEQHIAVRTQVGCSWMHVHFLPCPISLFLPVCPAEAIPPLLNEPGAASGSFL